VFSDPLGKLGFPSYLPEQWIAGVPAIYLSEYVNNGSTNDGTDPYGNYRLGQDTGQLTATLDQGAWLARDEIGFDAHTTRSTTSDQRANGIFTFDQHGSDGCR